MNPEARTDTAERRPMRQNTFVQNVGLGVRKSRRKSDAETIHDSIVRGIPGILVGRLCFCEEPV
jgi:hypothetical protein